MAKMTNRVKIKHILSYVSVSHRRAGVAVLGRNKQATSVGWLIAYNEFVYAMYLSAI